MAKRSKDNNGAVLGFEETLWQTADKLRGHMDAAEYIRANLKGLGHGL
jgi:type I restriction enzyme M protein